MGLAIHDDINMLELVALNGTAENTIKQKVPEPSSLALLICGGLMLARRRRLSKPPETRRRAQPPYA